MCDEAATAPHSGRLSLGVKEVDTPSATISFRTSILLATLHRLIRRLLAAQARLEALDLQTVIAVVDGIGHGNKVDRSLQNTSLSRISAIGNEVVLISFEVGSAIETLARFITTLEHRLKRLPLRKSPLLELQARRLHVELQRADALGVTGVKGESIRDGIAVYLLLGL